MKLDNVQATVKALTPRKEHHGEELVSAHSLEVEATVDAAILEDLCGRDWKRIRDALVDKDGVPRASHITIVPELTLKDYRVRVGSVTLRGAKLTKFKVAPVVGGFEVRFKVNAQTDRDDAGGLVDAYMESVSLSVEPETADMLKDDAA